MRLMRLREWSKTTHILQNINTKQPPLTSLCLSVCRHYDHISRLPVKVHQSSRPLVVDFPSSSAESPVMFHCVLIGPFAHVVNARVPYCKTLEQQETGVILLHELATWLKKKKKKKGSVLQTLMPVSDWMSAEVKSLVQAVQSPHWPLLTKFICAKL